VTTKTKDKTTEETIPATIVETSPTPGADAMLDAAKDTGLVAADANVETLPDLADDLATLDPKAVKTMTEDVLGRQIIITRVALHESQLAPDGSRVETDEATKAEGDKPREYASIEFYLIGDATLRFLTTGAGRLVPVIRNMIERKYRLPVRATIMQSRTSKGVRFFHFKGKDEAAK
jgi:hypothetical protein